MKKIVFIEPNGVSINQDFFLKRISKYFKKTNIKTYLLQYNKNNYKSNQDIVDFIITVKNENDFFDYLDKNDFGLIFHRSWMHRYTFASKIATRYQNSVIYIKDWMDELNKDEYKLLYDTVEDIDSMRIIFQSNVKILSHYSKKYTNKLAAKYNINKNNFIFFPEYCNKENFLTKDIKNRSKNLKLLWAGGLANTSKPIQICEDKMFFEAFKIITEQKISIGVYLLEKKYDEIYSSKNKKLWLDWIYEDMFNQYFSIKKSSELVSAELDEFSFAVTAGLYYNKDDKSLANTTQAVISKFAFYLEAGIPLIVNEKWEAISTIVKRNNIGIVINNNELYNLKKKLTITKKEYQNMVENIYLFREKYTYNNQTMKPILELIKE